ncbi:MAG: CoB--CoM heterodisulfide reductase iron-sulfur subunit A [Candidatus Lokiarchaeum sp. GC14_75]|nr:MAG: CoB--CoM heterodisulfide reductase iron-sulfur subunit A [Candidatus Lokiarchaeum sp. GC14_75]
MSDESYVKLREYINENSIGFPETSSNVGFKILKKLFSEEEAEIILKLKPSRHRETADQVAKRTGLDKSTIEKELELLSKKGLLFRIRRGNTTIYNLAPFMIGLYEYSVDIVDEDLAKLYREYFDTTYIYELAKFNVPGFKVIPIEETIENDTVLLPYQKIKESIKNARVISVAECICRKEARLVQSAHKNDHPIESCLSFGAAAEYYIENGIGREITADEAIKILEEADEAGLVHAGANKTHLSNICNCCPCCCGLMRGITHFGLDKHKFMNAIFESIIDKDLCIACNACVDRCPVGAISIEEDFAVVDRNKCLGCGLCHRSCPEEAIILQLREDRMEPFSSLKI